jgi:hypothetical protein
VKLHESLFIASDFIGIRAALVKQLGGDANRAIVLTRIYYRADARWIESHDMNAKWWWRATYQTIAEETGLSHQQVRRCLSWLEEKDCIEAVEFRLGGAYDHTRSYRVKGLSESTDDVSESTLLDVSESTLLPLTEDKEIYTSNHFDDFYSAWPKKVGKPDARRAFAKATLIATVDPQIIIDAARAYAENARRTGQEKQFIPNPATWLNREGWNDDLPGTKNVSPIRPKPLAPAAPRGRNLNNLNDDDYTPAFPEPLH